MYFYISFAILPFVAHVVFCESTKEPPKDILTKTTVKNPLAENSTSALPSDTFNRGSIWDKTPMGHISNQPAVWRENKGRFKMLLKPPHSLTKLAKTLSLEFEPSFSKHYFGPFERRPRPVTLVAFRKRGYASRQTVQLVESKEVAEQQSPFNEISSFWQNDQWDT